MSDRIKPFDEDRLTRQEAADYLGVSVNTLEVWACTGRYELRFYRVGRKVFYRRSDCDDWLARRAAGSIE